MRRRPAIIATMVLSFAAAGCSSRPTQTDRRFDVNKWLLATIRGADRVTLYEGLPHPTWERDLLDQERQTKPTVELNGYPFYTPPLVLADADRSRLTDVLGDERSFAPMADGVVPACGGFHPDFLVEWSTEGREYRCLVCFGCHEVKVFGPGGELECILEAADPLKRLLVPYRKNRPAGEVWPPSFATGPGSVPDREGGK